MTAFTWLPSPLRARSVERIAGEEKLSLIAVVHDHTPGLAALEAFPEPVGLLDRLHGRAIGSEVARELARSQRRRTGVVRRGANLDDVEDGPRARLAGTFEG